MKNILRKLYYFLKSVQEKPIPSDFSNFEYNRELWNRYAKRWNKTKVYCEKEKRSHIKHIGDEWGTVSDVEKIVDEYIYPFITKESVVAEIGVGGARVALKVVDRSREFYCFDISSEMLRRAKAVLGDYSHVRYVFLDQPQFPNRFVGKFDFVYSFDVFVHLDLHTMWKYFKGINDILKNGGRAFIHTTNLNAPDGWKRFSNQKDYCVEGHYFVSPEIIDILAQHSSLRIIKRSTIDPDNFYLNRDYLVVLEKK